MHEMAQKLMNTPLFSFQDLKLKTTDIITVLKDTLNTTSNPHATRSHLTPWRNTQLAHVL